MTIPSLNTIDAQLDTRRYADFLLANNFELTVTRSHRGFGARYRLSLLSPQRTSSIAATIPVVEVVSDPPSSRVIGDLSRELGRGRLRTWWAVEASSLAGLSREELGVCIERIDNHPLITPPPGRPKLLPQAQRPSRGPSSGLVLGT